MDSRRTDSPVYGRQWSSESGSTGSSSPAMSPARHHHHHSRSSSVSGFSNIKKTQNFAARAAAQRLAQVMAAQTSDDIDDDEDDLTFQPPPLSFTKKVNTSRAAVSSNRTARSPSPAHGRNFVDEVPQVRSTSTGRPSITKWPAEGIPPVKTSSRKNDVFIVPPSDKNRYFSEAGQINPENITNKQNASALRDELDMLQEDNENILEKLRLEEQKCEETEARVRELEKQVTALGEGISLEAKLLSRKEAVLRQKEDAFNHEKQMESGVSEEITSLQSQVENGKAKAAVIMEQLHGAESEFKALQTVSQRMVLSQKEMEDVVLKRCWLARYWGLAVQHGICSDVAVSKNEHWSSLSPLPFEIVLSAGQKAKEEFCNKECDEEYNNERVLDLNDLGGEGNVESVLSVEMGLKELASLKVEDAIILAISQQRRLNSARPSFYDMKSHGDQKFNDAFELGKEESEDVLFKEAWLTHFWRRAKTYGVEKETAERRLQFWTSHTVHSPPSSHDAIEVEQGLMEFRKLGIESRLWEASRKETGREIAASITRNKC